MITFLDENDVEYGALATIKVTNAVNGERSLTGTIVSGDYVLSNIERGWRLRFDDEYYVVTYAKPVDEGRDVQVTFDAVHQFFWDFDKSSVYDQLSDGSHTFAAYLDFIFKKSGYSYTVDSALNVHAFEKQSFGLKKRLTLFNDIITSTGVEFQVNGKVVRILEKVGTDLSTIVRKNFNMNELKIEKNIGDFVTYQKGYGAYFDEEDQSKGRLVVEYTNPLASVYGKLEAEPFVDERYSQSSSMLAVLKENVDNSYTISVSLDMEDLTRAGYKYKQPVAGDYIMAINETLGFQEKIRIVSFASEYDVQGNLVKHEVTCNDIGTVKKLSASYNLTKKQASSASATASNAYSIANKALVSADGKNTNYYSNSFPIDNPKGTLKTGDLLFLTVGDTVKQYYWNGADWVINPVIDDVEAFKEQIADELKDVPNREEFENKISEELANSKAEIETQIETAKTQAESNAKEYADTINQETAKVAEQANAAAGEIKADLVNVKNNLTDTSLVANNAQAAADAAKQELAEVNTKVDSAKAELTQAKQQLTTVSNDLSNAKADFQNAVSAVDTKATNLQSDVSNLNTSLSNTVKALQTQGTTLANQAKELQIQASQLTEQAKAQETLTTRVENVETTANGTKTTVSELSKTVTQNGKDITSVSNRTKTVETGLTSAKTSISELQTSVSTAQTDLTNLTKRTKTVEDGLTGTKTNLSELTQTVSNDGKTIASLTSRTKTVEDSVSGLKTTMSSVQKDLTAVTTRTKTVEDDLSGTKTTLSQVKTTADSTSQKAATLETGLNGLTAKFETLKIGSRNYFKDSKSRKYYIDSRETQDVRIYIDDEFWQNDTRFTKNYVRMSFDIAFNPALPSNFTTKVHFGASPWYNCGGITFKGDTTALQHFDLKFNLSGADNSYKTDNIFIRLNNTLPLNTAVSLENLNLYLSAVVEDYSQNEAELEQKVAEYKQNADQNYASLQSTVQALDGTVTANKATAEQTAAGFKTRIESLETYKSGESTRANQYFESAKTETARQLTAERTAIAKDYVAKSTYTSDVTGIRNDLTATTTTANTTKTNLANYQASNDKAVANLQSSLQTTNGNVSSLKTKVEAVPGQITSAVSAVEGKIPTQIGGTNLLLYSSDPWKAPSGYYAFYNAAKTDETYNGAVVYKTWGAWDRLVINLNNHLVERGLIKVGDVLTYSVLAKTDQETPIQSRLYVRYNNQSFTENINGKPEKINLTKEWQKVSVTFTVTEKMLSEEHRVNYLGWEQTTNTESGKFVYYACNKIEKSSIPSDWTPAPEDTANQISSLSSQIQQTADGMTLLATKTELNSAKTELQSGITTATNKANAAQSTANNNAQTISTHTTQISALNTGLQAKVSQADFNTLSGRVTTAENNITAKANELSSKITSVEGKIPTSVGGTNYLTNIASNWQNKYVVISGASAGSFLQLNSTTRISPKEFIAVEAGKQYTISLKELTDVDYYFKVTMSTVNAYDKPNSMLNADEWIYSDSYTFTAPEDCKYVMISVGCDAGVTPDDLNTKFNIKLERGNIPTDYSPSPEDYDSALTQAKSEIKQTTDAITASVSSLDNSTVKSASLTINTDGVVIKAGKSTTDVANAIGSYFAVNQNAINLFSDKINVKGNMIVNGAITSDKIASKSINTAHLNGKIITADVISSNAVTADAIKAGAVTTDKMSANSINGDRITAGTLDAAKIKAGSITASQIASGTITSNQIKAGGISAANIATGAITADKIAAGAINADKIAANAITADKIKAGSITADMFKGNQITSLNGATTLNLHTGEIIFNNQYATINQTKGSYKSQISLFSLDNGAVTEGAWSSVNTLAFNNTKLTSATRRAGSTVDMFPTFSLMTLYGERIAFTGEKSGSPGSNNAIIITTKPEEVNFTNGLTNNSKGKWNYSMIMDFGTKAVINVPDIKLDGHLKSLTGILDDLCKKAGIMWI